MTAGRLRLVTGLVCLALAPVCATLSMAQQPAAPEPESKTNVLTAQRETEGTANHEDTPGRREASRKKLLAAVSIALVCGAFATVLALRRKKRIYGGIDHHDLSASPPMTILPVEDAKTQEISRQPAAEGLPHVSQAQAVMSSNEPAEVEMASNSVTAATEPATMRRGFAGEVWRGPMLVERHAARVPEHEEIAEEEPLIAMANGTLHEKMAPMLSGRRESLSTAGDSGMIRTKSWLDRLLRRDTSPSRIVPENEDGDAAQSGATSRVSAPEDYDLPLATRLDQISRQRAVAPTSTTKASSRLQIVQPDEPYEIMVPAWRPLMDGAEEMKQIAAPEAEPVHEVSAVLETAEHVLEHEDGVAESAPPVFAEERQFAVLAEIPTVESFPVETPVVEQARRQGPRRPLSFQQLNEMTQEREWAQTATQAVSPLPVEAPEPVVEPVFHTAPLEVAAAVEATATPMVKVEPEPAPQIIPVEESAPVLQVAATSDEPAHVSEQPVFVEARPHEYPAQYEAEDIEPVYEEVSRHLTTGRWDPIPTLRPDKNGWRERPSPIPPTNPNRNDAAQRRWTGGDDDMDAWRIEAQPMPEPLLTRQWGLLSKFQQARMSSGQHPVAKTADNDKPGSGDGKR